MTEETSASTIYHLLLRLDRFIIDFILNLIITILIGLVCRADCFSNTGTASSRDRSSKWAVSSSVLLIFKNGFFHATIAAITVSNASNDSAGANPFLER